MKCFVLLLGGDNWLINSFVILSPVYGQSRKLICTVFCLCEELLHRLVKFSYPPLSR